MGRTYAGKKNPLDVCDESDSTIDKRLDSNKSKSRKYPQKYKKKWEYLRPWLKEDPATKGAYCIICQKCLNNNITNLNRHASSNYHKRKEIQSENQLFMLEKALDEVDNNASLGKELQCISDDDQKAELNSGQNSPQSTVRSTFLPKPMVKRSEAVKKKKSSPCPPMLSYQVPHNISPIVMVWSEKLQTLDPQQRVFAEKAINDILFEANQGTLHRHSVKINVQLWQEIETVTTQPSFTKKISQNKIWMDNNPLQPQYDVEEGLAE